MIKDVCTKQVVLVRCNNEINTITSYLYNGAEFSMSNGGNLNIQYEGSIRTSDEHQLFLSDLLFSLGINGSYTSGTGLVLVSIQGSPGHVRANIYHTTSYRNQGYYGANYYFEVLSSLDIEIFDANSKLGLSTYGSVYYHLFKLPNVHSNTTALFLINASIFQCNYAQQYAASMNIQLYGSSLQSTIIFENSTFWNDTSYNGVSIFVASVTDIAMYITNCTFRILQLNGNYGQMYIEGFSKNQVFVSNSLIMYTVLLLEAAEVYVRNSTFNFALVGAIRSTMVCSGIVYFQNSYTHLSGGAVALYSSSVLIIDKYASVNFVNNNATNGGALFIDQSSTINFTSPCNVTFINNTAYLSGGAIYVQEVNRLFEKSRCFFQFNETSNTEQYDVNVYFEGNHADEAGSVLYGGAIDNCILYCNNMCNSSSGSIFDMITHVGNHDDSVSIYSSDPIMICYCNLSMPLNCSDTLNNSIVIYPGEEIPLPIITLGQRNGAAPGIIYIYYNDGRDVIIISVLRSKNLCDVYSIPYRKEIGLYYQFMTIRSSLIFRSGIDTIALNISVLPCPIGFDIDNTLFKCICNDLLQSHGLTCEIKGMVLSWPSGEKWIGNTSHGVLGIVDDCPYDYCRDTANLSILNPNLHCSFNHCGVMCGQCCGGLSMKFGSSQCGNCANYYMLLLIPFAIMGVVMVYVLAVINFTVTSGTINGLILYAFVIKLNAQIFFLPSCGGEYKVVKIISGFVAWLNFDLGIETCFYDGMGSIGKVWLQFVFPGYVIAIIVVIVFAGSVSNTVSRLCRRYHMISVIGTLVLLVYSKMLRVILNIFTFSRIYTSTTSSQFVWSYDGNVPYVGTDHIGLFIVGVLVTVVFIVPYTLLLLLTQYLVRLSHWRIFRWMNNIKPLVDCYEAPFKDQYRFWTGAMLIYRIALGIITTLFSQEPTLILLAIVVLHAAILFSGFAIYKSWIISALESVLHISLITNSLMLFILVQSNYQCPSLATAIFGSVAFLCFLGILAHSIYAYVQLNCKRAIGPRPQSLNSNGAPTENHGDGMQHVYVNDDEYREPLLESIK